MDLENRRLSEAAAITSGEDAVDPAHLPLPGGHRRNAVRRIFREMVREELSSTGPLSAAKRRELVEFAATAGLDPYEARLTVRAVEYEMGMAVDLTVDPHEEGALSLLTPTTWFLVRLAAAVALGFILAWFMSRVQGRF